MKALPRTVLFPFLLAPLLLTGVGAHSPDDTGTDSNIKRLIYKADGKEPEIKMMQVVAPSNVVDLGILFNGSVTNVPFRIRNTGKQPIAIKRLVPTCSCITGTQSTTNDIPPGGEAVVTMTINTATVHDIFDRGMWVCANDTSTPYLQLKFTGEVKPLVSGLSEKPEQIRLRTTGVSVTHKTELVTARPEWKLGTPVIVTNTPGFNATPSLKPVEGKPGAYTLEIVAVPSVEGRHRLVLTLPVSGPPGDRPLIVSFVGAAAAALTATPRQIPLALDAEKQTALFVLNGPAENKLVPEKVIWDALPKGVTATALPGRQENDLLIRVEIAADAVEALYADKNAAVKLTHEGIGSLTVPFGVGAPALSEEPASHRRNRRIPDMLQQRGTGKGGRGNLRF
jgi:hypothetical protein